MPSTKKYNRDELLDIAIEVFRDSGFNGTSTADLVRALNINRKTMYTEFGSKQGLFEAVLERYSNVHLSAVLAPIESADASLSAITEAFQSYADSSQTSVSGRGCLLCNTAIERSVLDPGSKVFVAAYFKRLTSAFKNAVINAQAQQEIDCDLNPDEVAQFLTTSLIGVVACIRAEAAPSQIRSAANIVTETLSQLTASSLGS